MRRLMCAAVATAVAAFSLSGCASTGFLGFLATTPYVDKRLETVRIDTEAQLAQTNNELHKVQAELNRRNDRAVAGVRDFTSHLDAIPEATLRQLLQVIQEYLRGKHG